MSPSDQRRLLSTGRKAFITVEPLLFGTDPDVPSTRAKVAAWCHNNLASSTFEVTATKQGEWTIECGTLEVLCMLGSDAQRVKEFFNYGTDRIPF